MKAFKMPIWIQVTSTYIMKTKQYIRAPPDQTARSGTSRPKNRPIWVVVWSAAGCWWQQPTILVQVAGLGGLKTNGPDPSETGCKLEFSLLSFSSSTWLFVRSWVLVLGLQICHSTTITGCLLAFVTRSPTQSIADWVESLSLSLSLSLP